tara:strand:+ start:525 stop:752 length:228 start_codon:yes stop_codon:yes gene_type:complete
MSHAPDQLKPRVSDHALVRYLERVRGLDVEAIRAEILTPRTVDAMAFVGDGCVPLCPGATAIVRDMTIITVLDRR